MTLFSISCQQRSIQKNTQTSRIVNKSIIDADKANKALSKDPIFMTTQVLAAMGGRENWDNLKFVSWTFFGSRHLIWDKSNNRVRIDSPRDSSVYTLNMSTGQGRFWYADNEVLDPEVKKDKMRKAKSIWINDMYWLFMPFKLNDPGVEILYLREDTLDSGQDCSLFSLTFSDVGDTPENKYDIYVDHSDHLIKKWGFYEKNTNLTADAIWPWDNYQLYNGLLLSGDRSDKKGPSNIRIYDQLDDAVFNALECFSYY